MSWIDFICSKAASLRNRTVDQLWERRLGIRTTGNVLIHEPDSHLYGTFSYTWINRILERLDLGRDDVFVDIGCGKGRILCCAARRSIRKVIGIDLDEKLCAQARDNATRMRGRAAPIEIIHARAQDFDYGDCTRFFLFHPFGAATLKLVVDSIEQSLRERPRSIQLVYLNPVNDYVLEEAGGAPGVGNGAAAASKFTRFDYWRSHPRGTLKHDVSFWQAGQPSPRPRMPSRQRSPVRAKIAGLGGFGGGPLHLIPDPDLYLPLASAIAL